MPVARHHELLVHRSIAAARARRVGRAREHGPALAIASIRHSSFCADPRGCRRRSSARRYHSPSQPCASSALRKACSCVAGARRAPRVAARAGQAAKSRSVAWRNQPSQTLSPAPGGADAVHAVVPVAGADQRQAVARRRARPRSRARTQWS